LCADFIDEPAPCVVEDVVFLTGIIPNGVVVGDMAKIGVDNETCPVRVGEVDHNKDGVIQERIDTAVLREPREDVVIGVRACRRYKLCEKKCIKSEIGAGGTCSGGVSVEEAQGTRYVRVV